MSDQFLKLIVVGTLLLHGPGHGGAIGALLWIDRRPGTNTGGWPAARSWPLPSLASPTATTVATVFWIVALVGFVAAAMSFWGVLLPAEVCRPVAVVSAAASLAGIVLFAGTWPAFNTTAALAMNVAALVSCPNPGHSASHDTRAIGHLQ